jgi:hypothetical protein
MRRIQFVAAIVLVASIPVSCLSPAAEPAQKSARSKKLNVLFVGNSFTACHSLATVVKAMA